MPQAKRPQPEPIDEGDNIGGPAVAELEPEVEQEPEQEEALFRSKGLNFRVVVVPRFRRFTEAGDQIVSEGVTAEFAPNGEYRTSDPKVIAHLRGLGSLNREFWEVGKEPGAVPSPEMVMEKVFQATVDFDDEALERLEREEENGFRREIVLRSIRSAREKVNAQLEKLGTE
jgi:hypothetical protein